MIPLSLFLDCIWIILFVLLLFFAVLYECLRKFGKITLDPKIMKPVVIAYIALFFIDVILAIVSDFV